MRLNSSSDGQYELFDSVARLEPLLVRSAARVDPLNDISAIGLRLGVHAQQRSHLELFHVRGTPLRKGDSQRTVVADRPPATAVHETTDATKRQAQHHAWRQQIGNCQYRQPMPAQKGISGYRAAQETAVDDQPAIGQLRDIAERGRP